MSDLLSRPPVYFPNLPIMDLKFRTPVTNPRTAPIIPRINSIMPIPGIRALNSYAFRRQGLLYPVLCQQYCRVISAEKTFISFPIPISAIVSVRSVMSMRLVIALYYPVL